MTTVMIFGLGIFVTLLTAIATLLVGSGESEDPDHNRLRREQLAVERVKRVDPPLR